MCDLNKPLIQCTLGDFIEAFSELHNRKDYLAVECKKLNMPKGMKGIMQIFSCSEYMARQIVKSGAIDSAIFRLGARTFVTDPERARQLYSNSKLTNYGRNIKDSIRLFG